MLRPTKHSHPDRTVVFMSFLLLKQLKKNRIEDFHSLSQYAKGSTVGGDTLFLPALNFLYLVGVIEYHPNSDAIEYVGANETV
jgi:hypothetical protein